MKPKDVVGATLQVLQPHNAHIYSEYYDMYLYILRKYVLQERSQRILLSLKQWSALLSVCKTILNKFLPNVDYVKLLETFELIIKHGCSLSNLMFEVKLLLPLIGKCILKD